MITNLDLKLLGQEPVTREELLELVSSWGRKDSFELSLDFNNGDDSLMIYDCDSKECYPLENLDVSQIDDLSFIFRESPYNGDLSNWDVSSCKNMTYMFAWSEFNNDSIKDWDTSKVENMFCLFFCSEFNGDVSKWDISNCFDFNSIFSFCNFEGDISNWYFKLFKHEQFDMDEMFEGNKSFINKYNNGKEISYHTKNILSWFEENTNEIINNISLLLIIFFNYKYN